MNSNITVCNRSGKIVRILVNHVFTTREANKRDSRVMCGVNIDTNNV